ncbi:MAG TPA: helix-turn-helix transcriptional regulator [Patescibacteria group bacterium]|nr:helix-turn-helix transcriptional regulator [Patescibacteria group bacterium]
MALRYELIDALKRLLKGRGMTYAQLATKIDLSEASVKRMFSQQTMTLARLDEICEALGIGLTELVEHARPEHEPLSALSEEQEEELVSDPRLFLTLYLALNRWREEDVLRRYSFTKPEWIGLLVRLDRMGIIELQPDNRAKLRTARNFRWRENGPVMRLFAKKLIPEFFARPFAGENEQILLLAGMVSRPTGQLLKQRLQELAREFDALMARDSVLPVAERVGLSLVLGVRPWGLPDFEKFRRKNDTTPA